MWIFDFEVPLEARSHLKKYPCFFPTVVDKRYQFQGYSKVVRVYITYEATPSDESSTHLTP